MIDTAKLSQDVLAQFQNDGFAEDQLRGINADQAKERYLEALGFYGNVELLLRGLSEIEDAALYP
jgi:hypothetical protein